MKFDIFYSLFQSYKVYLNLIKDTDHSPRTGYQIKIFCFVKKKVSVPSLHATNECRLRAVSPAATIPYLIITAPSRWITITLICMYRRALFTNGRWRIFFRFCWFSYRNELSFALCFVFTLLNSLNG